MVVKIKQSREHNLNCRILQILRTIYECETELDYLLRKEGILFNSDIKRNH